MTTKHLAQGLMMLTRSRSHAHCEQLLGLPQGAMHHWSRAMRRDVKASTLDLIRQKTGISGDVMLDWYRMKDGESLPPPDGICGRCS